MKITKFGHSCLLIEEGELRCLLDPGSYSSGQDVVTDIDVILITHEHQDHVAIDSLKAVIRNNPGVKIYTNASVGVLLAQERIDFSLCEHGQSVVERGVKIEAVGNEHACFHATIPPIQNTGFFIANKFFYPGDSFMLPGKPVEILGLPMIAPWMKISEAVDYTLAVKPRICIPMHDGILKVPELPQRIPKLLLEPAGIEFMSLEVGKEYVI